MKIHLKSKNVTITRKSDGKEITFRRYWTDVNTLVKGEEDKGMQHKTLEVRFKQGVEHAKMYSGILDGDIGLPFIYEVKEKNGVKEYPVCWVRSVKSFTPINSKSSVTPILEDEVEEETGIELE